MTAEQFGRYNFLLSFVGLAVVITVMIAFAFLFIKVRIWW